MKTAVIITTYNEAESIGYLVKSLKGRGWSDYVGVFVVDESSTDSTIYEASEAGANVLGCERGAGIGPCLMHGWEYVLNLPADFSRFVQIDAGGSHDASDLAPMIIKSRNHDVIVGSRFLPDSNYYGRPLRRNLSRLYGMACNLITGAKFTDWTSGYRVFSRLAIETLIHQQYSSKYHSWQAEVLAAAYHAGLSIAEAPITYHAGRSSFNRHIAAEAIRSLWHIATGDVHANRVGVNLPQ